MDFYYDINTNKFIHPDVLERTRRIATYVSRFVDNSLPYRQVYLCRWCNESGKEVCVKEPIYGLIYIDDELQKHIKEDAKVFIQKHIKTYGYKWDPRKIVDDIPDESVRYETLYHKYETNNWLKAHHLPKRRKYRKNTQRANPFKIFHHLPIGIRGTGKSAKYIKTNI